jgi:hypothetical protein
MRDLVHFVRSIPLYLGQKEISIKEEPAAIYVSQNFQWVSHVYNNGAPIEEALPFILNHILPNWASPSRSPDIIISPITSGVNNSSSPPFLDEGKDDRDIPSRRPRGARYQGPKLIPLELFKAPKHISKDIRGEWAYWPVVAGRVPGIYMTWSSYYDELATCWVSGAEAQIKGFPNPIFRGFSNKRAARQWARDEQRKMASDNVAPVPEKMTAPIGPSSASSKPFPSDYFASETRSAPLNMGGTVNDSDTVYFSSSKKAALNRAAISMMEKAKAKSVSGKPVSIHSSLSPAARGGSRRNLQDDYSSSSDSSTTSSSGESGDSDYSRAPSSNGSDVRRAWSFLFRC